MKKALLLVAGAAVLTVLASGCSWWCGDKADCAKDADSAKCATKQACPSGAADAAASSCPMKK